MADEPERLDAPNQQTVRADQSGPADEGTGGRRGAPRQYADALPDQRPRDARAAAGSQYAAERTKALDDMTKDELVAEAKSRGVDVDASMTKAEIREALGA